jgi:hypothetical protein
MDLTRFIKQREATAAEFVERLEQALDVSLSKKAKAELSRLLRQL